MLGNQNWSLAITETFLVVFRSRVTDSITTQGDTATQCVRFLPRDQDLDLALRRSHRDLDLALVFPRSREEDLGRRLDGDLFLSPRFHVLLEELELDLVADLVLSEAEIEPLLEREASLRFSDDESPALLVLSSSFGFLTTSAGGGDCWVFLLLENVGAFCVFYSVEDLVPHSSH